MNRSIFQLLLCALVPLSGCDSSRAPSFTLSEQSKELSDFAQERVEGELESGFGTPSSLVVWSQLEVDFGHYSGKVAKVGPKNILRIGEPPAEDDSADQEQNSDGGEYDGLVAVSALASESRLADLRGAAVVISRAKQEAPSSDGEGGALPAKDSAVYRVASYDVGKQRLAVVDGNGAPAQLDVAAGDTVQIFGSELQRGRNLYLRHCMHCHGVSGDGAGPTAQYFKVKPRDYRQGKMKFTSTKTGIRPSRDDVFRIIKLGVPGTYMPSFMLLPDDEVKAIGEYVRWLAMRGEMERKLNAWLSLGYSKKAVADADETEAEIQAEFDEEWAADASEYINDSGEELQVDWGEAEKSESIANPTIARIPASPESIKRGREIYLNSKKGACFSCHGETGRGNGPSTEGFNDVPGQPGTKSDIPGLFDDWGNSIKPRDLTTGVFRGGRRPIDIYRRIHSGIKGTPMQQFGSTLKEEQIWDVVNYVLSIPFEDKQGGH